MRICDILYKFEKFNLYNAIDVCLFVAMLRGIVRDVHERMGRRVFFVGVLDCTMGCVQGVDIILRVGLLGCIYCVLFSDIVMRFSGRWRWWRGLRVRGFDGRLRRCILLR